MVERERTHLNLGKLEAAASQEIPLSETSVRAQWDSHARPRATHECHPVQIRSSSALAFMTIIFQNAQRVRLTNLNTRPVRARPQGQQGAGQASARGATRARPDPTVRVSSSRPARQCILECPWAL